jgi:hypothetical protein
MRVCVYSTKPYDREFLTRAAAGGSHVLDFLDTRLTVRTAELAADATPVRLRNDIVDADIVGVISSGQFAIGDTLSLRGGFDFRPLPVFPWYACRPIRRTPWPSTRSP